MKSITDARDELQFCLEVCRLGSDAFRMVGGSEDYARSYFNVQSIQFQRSIPEVRAISHILYSASLCDTLEQSREHILYAIEKLG